jgi:transcriptional repressor NrdR
VFCRCEESRVIDSRSTEDGCAIRRRRECERCGRRFTTYETVDLIPLMVIKKDKRRETFDPNKLRHGISKACEKRPVPVNDIEALMRSIEMSAYNSYEQEVTTKQLGEMVMDGLREIDEVAYVRFASVYRQFADIQTFMDELSKLLTSNK